MICPNCGNEAEFSFHHDIFVETHGLECGPYETWYEEWMICSTCGSETYEKELLDCQPTESEYSSWERQLAEEADAREPFDDVDEQRATCSGTWGSE